MRRLHAEQESAAGKPHSESGDIERHADTGIVDDPIVFRVHYILRLGLLIGRSVPVLVSTTLSVTNRYVATTPKVPSSLKTDEAAIYYIVRRIYCKKTAKSQMLQIQAFPAGAGRIGQNAVQAWDKSVRSRTAGATAKPTLQKDRYDGVPGTLTALRIAIGNEKRR